MNLIPHSPFSADLLGLVLSPWHIGILVILVVTLFAPQLMAPIGRMLGKLMRAEVRRRTGIAIPREVMGERAPARPEAAREPRSAGTVIEIDPSESVARPAGARRETLTISPAREAPTAPPEPRDESPARAAGPSKSRSSGAPVWLMGGVVAGAAGVLLWLLLHAR
jgi:Sec-independent protein translocase protein TatA